MVKCTEYSREPAHSLCDRFFFSFVLLLRFLAKVVQQYSHRHLQHLYRVYWLLQREVHVWWRKPLSTTSMPKHREIQIVASRARLFPTAHVRESKLVLTRANAALIMQACETVALHSPPPLLLLSSLLLTREENAIHYQTQHGEVRLVDKEFFISAAMSRDKSKAEAAYRPVHGDDIQHDVKARTPIDVARFVICAQPIYPRAT